MKNRIRNFLIPVSIYIMLRCVFIIGFVPTTSMEPAIPTGSLIIGIRLFDEIEKGDIVIFRHENRLLVKRVWGVPGDVILPDEILFDMDLSKPGWAEAPMIVPEGCYFLLGDNSTHSIDSRYWDDPFARSEEIVGVLIWIPVRNAL